MNEEQSRPTINRRQFLGALTATGVTAVAGYALYEYTPWLNYDERANTLRRPFDLASTAANQQVELVRYATLAASGHNTQPWQFAIHDNQIDIYPDFSRHLPIVDPNDRELWISLGCALENLLVAAHATGYATSVTYPETADFIRVELTPDTQQPSPLFEAIPLRQNTRCPYNGRLVKNEHLDQLQALPLEPGVALSFALNPETMQTVNDYVNQGNLDQFSNMAFKEELIEWLRFTKKDALASADGLFSRCSGNPEVPSWLGQLVLAGMKPEQQASDDTEKLLTSPSAVVIASQTDDKTAWVRTGQVYERLALQMTAFEIKSAMLNQPIEVATLRSQFQTALGLGAFQPQLLLRFGYAEAMPRSLRRPVEDVLI